MLHLEKLEDFDNLISKGKVVVDFYADWCGPCKMLSPIIEEVADENENITFIKVNTDDFLELAKRYAIMSIPSIKVFEDGKITKTHVGFMNKEELEELIK